MNMTLEDFQASISCAYDSAYLRGKMQMLSDLQDYLPNNIHLDYLERLDKDVVKHMESEGRK